jgi:spore maturation protein CgeB
MRITVIGLSLTSAWGNGHASTYRSLLKALHARGHEIAFLERDVAWYRDNRDLADPEYARVELYDQPAELGDRLADDIQQADLVIVGSYVPDGPQVIDLVLKSATGVRAFYDIDTPVTLGKLEAGEPTYIEPDQIPKFDVYLSFTGGPSLRCLEGTYGARRARALYCSVDPEAYAPDPQPPQWDLGYLGTYSGDRAAGLELRLLEPARRWQAGRFVVAGAQFPERTCWPENVEHIHHVPPSEHRPFFGSQRFTLNLTRKAMVDAGYSPSVRLFEAAACGVPMISDHWPGLEEFFTPGEDILVSRSADETLDYLTKLSDDVRHSLAAKARARVLAGHTAVRRAEELEDYTQEAAG